MTAKEYLASKGRKEIQSIKGMTGEYIITPEQMDEYAKQFDNSSTSKTESVIPSVTSSLLVRSLSLLEEMIDNHQADAVLMSEQHYKEVKQLVKDIHNHIFIK